MIFIDAREGLSGDMLLAAMAGLLDEEDWRRIATGVKEAAAEHGLEFEMLQIEESGESGLGIACRELEPGMIEERSYGQCFSLLAEVEGHLGASSPAGGAILRTIFEAEGQAHGLPTEEVHLHEIGRPMAILNIAAIGHLCQRLTDAAAGPFVCSTITTGRGIVVVSHGAVRVPPPASLALLKDMAHQPGDAPGERATPTGIAAVKALMHHQSDDLPAAFKRKSIGFGTRRFAGRLGRTTLLWT